MKITVVDSGWGLFETVREYLPPQAEFSGYSCQTGEEAVAVAADADGIMAEYVALTREVLSQLKKCKIISISAVGVDNVDLKAATDLGIAVANVPGYCSHEVADHAMALLLSINRNILRYDSQIKKGIWDIDSAPPMRRLAGQTLGLVGFGKIAQMVAERGKGFGLRILAFDPYVSAEFTRSLGVTPASLEEVLAEGDVISLHLPLSEATAGFINRSKFALMKKHPLLINTSRGKVLSEGDLIEALESGQLSGAALDVLASEPPDFGSPLFGMENVIITPHAGFYSETSAEELRRRCALNITHFLAGEYDKVNIVNREVLNRI